ncbi:YqhG family protein [Halobacillus seohaensis]|uniref:YqhG family protein n=1 Tax=Halobacillus seohaensis TaxID=447421 RepID=A0ABW2EI92_9BACI
MNANKYYEFTKEFFTINGCTIEELIPNYMTVHLTKEMDESLMNRPFYWHYMKKMNREGEPMSLSFKDISLGDQEEGVFLHAGTPKLQQIYQVALEKGFMTRLYEAVESKDNNNLALHPWLFVNIKLTFRGKQSKDQILSIGLNLINGALIHDAMDKIIDYSFNPKISDYTFPMTPVIRLESGYNRIVQHTEAYISKLDTEWASHSIEQLNYEKQLLEGFYNSNDIEEEQYEKELDQLNVRYKPRITLSVANGGLIYLSVSTSQQLLQ